MVLDNPKNYTLLTNAHRPLLDAILYNLEQDGRNPFYIGEARFNLFINSWLVAENCPFRNQLTKSIMRIQSAGLLEYYKRNRLAVMRGIALCRKIHGGETWQFLVLYERAYQ